MKESSEGGMKMLVPLALAHVLDNFEDQILRNLSKGIPSICVIDHYIELELWAKPMEKDPYRLFMLVC